MYHFIFSRLVLISLSVHEVVGEQLVIVIVGVHRKFSNFELEADILSIDTILPN